jgi:hypothetical protein
MVGGEFKQAIGVQHQTLIFKKIPMSGVYLVQGERTLNPQELVLANSAVIQYGDFVTIDSNGFLNRSAATEKIAGIYAEQQKTVTADNQTVAAVKGVYIPINGSEVFEMTADQACTQTDVGQYADIVLSSTAILANLNSGATGGLFVIDFDPNRDGTTTLVRVQVAEPQRLGFAQA